MDELPHNTTVSKVNICLTIEIYSRTAIKIPSSLCRNHLITLCIKAESMRVHFNTEVFQYQSEHFFRRKSNSIIIKNNSE